MVTRLKPQRVKSSNSPQVGQNLGYEDSNNFKWQDTGSGVGDMKYSDFQWKTLTGNAITIEDISNNITPSSNFTVSAGTVKPGIEYVLRVNTGNTAYTMTLGTGVTNPNGYSTELTPNKVNQFKFIATSNSQLELEGVDTSEYLTGLTILSYGTSTWNDFITAYNKNAIVYCRASSNSNPATGSQTRLAFMAYVNNADTPTEVEFQYYRSRSSHGSDANQQDEVYVYKLTNASGGTWTVEVRDTAAKIATGTGLTKAYTTSGSKSTLTIANDGVLTVNGSNGTVTVNDIKQSATAPANPTAGTAWYDTTNGVLKVYNGTAWDNIATGGAISDTAYGSTWDGQTTTAPSQNAVYDKISTMDTAISSNTTNINTINNKIPSEASSSNQLADKAYVGDSINSVTAYYITKDAQGNQWSTYSDLSNATVFYSGGVVRTPTKNDYTIVLDDENHDHATTRYIYNNGWEYQYTVNETPLTQAQLNALNSGITAAKVAKYDTLNTREFTLSGVGSSATVLAEAQEVFDWINAGNFAILKIATDSGQPTYLYKSRTVDDLRFLSSDMVDGGYSDNFTTAMQKGVEIQYSGTTVTGVSYINNLTWQFLAINGQYQSAFMPTQDAHPATKKYVDSKSTVVSATAPSSPVEGQLWYDTTNDVLKVYDGTNWVEVGKEYNAGEGIEIGTGQDYSAMRGPCDEGFHIPTKTELQGIQNIFSQLSITFNVTNISTYLKIPKSGWRGDVNLSQPALNLTGQGNGFILWTCNAATDDESSYYSDKSSWHLYSASNSTSLSISGYRFFACSIRPFKNITATPDSTWTILYDGSSVTMGAGIFHNTIDGLISLSGDGVNRITIADKNVGATSNDITSPNSYGYLYQWGNNYGFSSTGTITNTTTTRIDASGYGPGNYYESFAAYLGGDKNNYVWDSSNNKNLRGGVTGIVTLENAITNTGVLSVNGQTGDVTIESGGLQVSPNSTITGIKYIWYGTESDYANLSQYYTDTPGDTEFHTF